MREDQIPVVNPEYVIENFDDEIIIYTKSSAKAVYLNDSAYAVLLLCKENFTVSQIITLLEDKYPDQHDHIKTDVYDTLDKLESINLITFSHAEE